MPSLQNVPASRSYVRVFAAYAIVVMACLLAVAAIDLLHFRPGDEFATPLSQFVFTVVVVGGSLLVLGIVPFALVLVPFMYQARTIRLPSLVGLLVALLVVLFAGIGTAGRYGRLLAVPAPIVAGALAAALVLPLVLVLSQGSHHSR